MSLDIDSMWWNAVIWWVEHHSKMWECGGSESIWGKSGVQRGFLEERYNQRREAGLGAGGQSQVGQAEVRPCWRKYGTGGGGGF